MGMKTLDLSVKFDEDLEQYQIFDKEHPEVILATAYTKESAYSKMLELAIAGAHST